MKRTGPPKRTTPLKRTGPPKRKTPLAPVNRARRAKESARAYGPRERREFVTRGLPCCACGAVPTEDRPNHQHHTRSGGVGRKSDADSIVPLCAPCHRLEHDGNLPHDVDWTRAARETEAAWQAHSKEG